MISRVIAEFESPELAETAVQRVRESVVYVYSGNIMYPPETVKGHFLSRGENHAVLPVSYSNSIGTNGNTVGQVVRRKNTTACVICGSGAVENVMAMMNAMGGMNIHSAV